MDQVGLSRHRGPANVPAGGVSPSPRSQCHVDPTSALNRSVHRFDDLHIREAFGAARFGCSIVQDALRELLQFRGELIAFAEPARAMALANP
jgi:hypothetical protein